jgi:hydrogenase maturation protease
MTSSALVVGYGNALRTDDGLGWQVAERLAQDPRLAGAAVLQRQQLMPELAFDVSAATLVVLVDASHGPPPGTFTISQVEPASQSTATWSHHLSPSTLVALADELYGRAPDVFLVSCGLDSTEIGDQLSPAVEAALPKVVDAVVELVASHAARLTADPE